MSAEGQPTPSPSRFRLCGRLRLGRVRKGPDPGQTGSAPSSNRRRVAAGRAKPVPRANCKPSTRAGRRVLPDPLPGNMGPGAGSAGARWGKSFPESAVSGRRLHPRGPRPRRPSGWGGRLPPGAHARRAPQTRPRHPKRLGPRWLHTQHPAGPTRGAHLPLREEGPPPSVLTASRMGTSPQWLRPGRVGRAGPVSTGGSPPARPPHSSACCLPAPTGSAPGGGGGHSLPPAWRRGCVSSAVLMPGPSRPRGGHWRSFGSRNPKYLSAQDTGLASAQAAPPASWQGDQEGSSRKTSSLPPGLRLRGEEKRESTRGGQGGRWALRAGGGEGPGTMEVLAVPLQRGAGPAGKRRRGPRLALHVGPHPAPCRCLLPADQSPRLAADRCVPPAPIGQREAAT